MGTHTRDFTHVDDIVRGMIAAAKHRLTGVYNLGTGESYNFNTVVDMLDEELGTDVEPGYVENPIPDSVYFHDTMASIEKMRKEAGWEPRISFEEGIERVCRQYTE